MAYNNHQRIVKTEHLMMYAAFQQGYLDKSLGFPWTPDYEHWNTKLQCLYERGRLLAAYCEGIGQPLAPLWNGKRIALSAIMNYKRAVASGAIPTRAGL